MEVYSLGADSEKNSHDLASMAAFTVGASLGCLFLFGFNGAWHLGHL
jgi:hypothetical protein